MEYKPINLTSNIKFSDCLVYLSANLFSPVSYFLEQAQNDSYSSKSELFKIILANEEANRIFKFNIQNILQFPVYFLQFCCFERNVFIAMISGIVLLVSLPYLVYLQIAMIVLVIVNQPTLVFSKYFIVKETKIQPEEKKIDLESQPNYQAIESPTKSEQSESIETKLAPAEVESLIKEEVQVNSETPADNLPIPIEKHELIPSKKIENLFYHMKAYNKHLDMTIFNITKIKTLKRPLIVKEEFFESSRAQNDLGSDITTGVDIILCAEINGTVVFPCIFRNGDYKFIVRKEAKEKLLSEKLE